MKNKIINDIDKLVDIVADLKAKNKKIVFGNGCFDILHVGHIRYLNGAKQLGDFLIVAVNSDLSFKRLKSDKKLFTPENERVEILASIECVDFVTIFSDSNVENLLLKLKPHIHAKGTDYTTETVPEKDVVNSYGGEVAIVGDPKNHSSSEIKRSLESSN